MEKLLFELINEKANEKSNVDVEIPSTITSEEPVVQTNVEEDNVVTENFDESIKDSATNVETKNKLVDKEAEVETSTNKDQTLFSKFKIHLNTEQVKAAENKVEVKLEQFKPAKKVVLETFKPKIKVKLQTFRPTVKIVVETFESTPKKLTLEDNIFAKRIEKKLYSEKLNLFNNRIKENLKQCELILEEEAPDPVLEAILEQLNTVQNLKSKLLNNKDISSTKLAEIEKILDRNISLLENGN